MSGTPCRVVPYGGLQASQPRAGDILVGLSGTLYLTISIRHDPVGVRHALTISDTGASPVVFRTSAFYDDVT